MHTRGEVFNLYRSTFYPLYADLVAATGEKPTSVLEQLEHCFSHFAVAEAFYKTDQETSHTNISRTYEHLMRVSLDVAKILWQTYRDGTYTLLTDEEIRNYCLNAPSGNAVFVQYLLAQEEAGKARRIEHENIGVNPKESINIWYKAASEQRRLLDIIKEVGISNFAKEKRKRAIKEFVMGFILGVVTSAVGSIIVLKFVS